MAETAAAPTLAATTGGSRTFNNAVVSWTPSTTDTAVNVTISIGGSQAAFLQFDSATLIQPFSNSGTGYTTQGTFYVSFGAGGTTGVLFSQEWTWTYNGVTSQWAGYIGNW
jgi:hypothetical protein